MPDIHQYPKRLEQALARVQKSTKIAEKDKELIERFSKALKTQYISIGRVAKYVNHLKTSAETLSEITKSDRGLANASKDDINEFSVWLKNDSGYTAHTRRDFITTFKRFYQWLKAPPDQYARWRRRHRYPDEVDDLSSNIKLNERFLPSDLLTQKEVDSMISAASNEMLKAKVAFSDEVGPRPGEDLSLRIRDIIFDGDSVLVRLAHEGGKTGERLVYLVKSVPLLTRWLEAHPLKDDPNAPLWLSQNNYNRYESWSYAAYRKALNELAKRANVRNKSVTPYLFRHTAATRDAKLGFTEAQLCLKYGWQMGSEMPRIYIHLAGTDLRRKIMEVYGGKEVAKPEPQMVNCPKCQEQNHTAAKFCSRCGSLMQLGARAVEMEEMKLQTQLKISNLEDALSKLQQKLDEISRAER
jgi:integrase/recombinase XerD